MPAVLISGVSSGLGLALAKAYLNLDYNVYGFSRRPCPIKHENLSVVEADIADHVNLPGKLFELLDKSKELEKVILNAGVLGKIDYMHRVPLNDMKKTMDINLWGNKTLLDWLFKHQAGIDQVIAISSGAAVNGNKGWNAYALSKAALNMMIQLYAAEEDSTHFCAFAPGLVDTAMQEYLCSLSESDEFTSLQRIQSCRGTEKMPKPDALALQLPDIFNSLKNYQSGSFVDLRTMT